MMMATVSKVYFLIVYLAIFVSPLLGQTNEKQLLKASKSGEMENVKEALSKGADVNFADWNGQTPLTVACDGGHLEVVKLLLKKGADPNLAGQYGNTPLGRAAVGRHPDLVRLLLKNGATVNKQNDRGETPFFDGVVVGSLEICRDLVESGADVNLPPADGHAPLNEGCTAGHFEIVRLILENGGTYEKTPLTNVWLAIVQRNVGELKDLLTSLKSVNLIEKDNSLLSWAALSRDPDIVKMFITAGADPNYGSPTDFSEDEPWFVTPLHRAAESGGVAVAQLLLDAGADASYRSPEGLTALDIAADLGYVDLVDLLLKRGAVVETADDRALLLACEQRNKSVIKTLLEHGVRAGAQAFELVLDPPDHEIAKWMIDAELAATAPVEKPPVSQPGEVGGTVKFGGTGMSPMTNSIPAFMYLSILRVENKLVRHILEAGSDPNMFLTDEVGGLEAFELGTMPLHLATYLGDKEIVMMLIQYNADVNAVINTVGYAVENGEEILVTVPITALDVAIDENRPKLAEFLMKKGALSAKALK